jgi:transcriptional regulator with XRE-family HTH domain
VVNKVTPDQVQTFGRWIRDVRLAKGIGCDELAGRCGNLNAKTIRRWEKGETFPNEQNYRSLLAELKIPPEEVMRVLGLKSVKSGTKLSAVSLADALKLNGDLKVISKVFESIGEEYPFPTVTEDEWGTDKNWSEIYLRSPETGFLLYDDRDIVGFWFFVFVDENTFRDGMAGKNINSSIKAKNVRVPIYSGNYKAYFADAFFSRHYRKPGSMTLLADAFFSTLTTFARSGVYVTDIFSNITTDYAWNIVNQSGFEKVADHEIHRQFSDNGSMIPTEIFHISLERNFNRLFQKVPHLTKEISIMYGDYFMVSDVDDGAF